MESYKLATYVGDKYVARLKREFLQRYEDTRTATDWQSVAEAIPMGEIAVYNSIQWGKWTPVKVMMDSYIEMQNRVRQMYQKDVEKDFNFQWSLAQEAFSMQNPAALHWLENYAGMEIRDFVSKDIKYVRALLFEGALEQLTYKEIAKNLEKDLGLTDKQHKALKNYDNTLKSKGIKDSRRKVLTDRYLKELLKNRSQTVAITELHKATSQAWTDELNRMVKDGTIKDKEYELVWYTAPDERRCEICGGLQGLTREPSRPDWPYGEPPVHPRCRCNTYLRWRK